MKSITHLDQSRSIPDQSDQEQDFDPEVAFSDPVGYLSDLGIESQLVSLSSATVVQEAA